MKLISYSESLRILRAQLEKIHGTRENIPVREALLRVLFAPVYARRSNPPDPLSAMDGIAIDARAAAAVPVTLAAGQWQRINTGEVVPAAFTAVVRIEDVRWEGENPVLEKPVPYFQNIRSAAEDFSKEDLLFPSEYCLQPPDLSLLLTAGVGEVEVFRKPLITFLPTGSELVQNPQDTSAGLVPESNSAMVGGMVLDWGGVLKCEAPIPDDPDLVTAAIRQAVSRSDVVVLSAGTSMGTRDFTFQVLEKLGSVLFHGVAIHPARPVLLAQIGDVPVLGLPGYPSAAFLAATLYLKPLVCGLSGRKPVSRQEVYISAEDIPARKEDSFYRVQCFDVDSRIYVRKIPRGAGSVMALSLMDGWMHVPPATEIKKRDAVRVEMLHDRSSQVIAIRGAAHPYATKLFDLFHAAMPAHRVLFWPSMQEDALDSIIERNTHMAVITTHRSRDLFPAFADRLQAWMLRCRLFTRTACLHLRPGISSLHPGATICVPESSAALWADFLEQEHLNASDYNIQYNGGSEAQLASALPAGGWDSVFADIRFLKSDGKTHGHVNEHYDLVVSEHHAESDPAIKMLLALALSSEYENWLGRQGAFDPASRGIL